MAENYALVLNTAPESNFKLRLHWQRLRHNAGDSNTHCLLALATLGGTTEIGSFLFMSR
jgi:hypothetical protein